VHAIGRNVIAAHADAVDKEARFPVESFDALRDARLLAAYVPVKYGGLGLSIGDLSRLCQALGQYCGSTAMVFAMHQIQVACIAHHALGSAHLRDYIADLAQRQYLLASATTEIGVGGDVRSSLCAVNMRDGRYTLEKQAPVISYGERADAILVTARRSADTGPGDQVLVLVKKENCLLKPLSGWDTLGFRGTCSPGFALSAEGPAEDILPVPYADIHGLTMHPFSHIVWASLWLGMASEAFNRARAWVRAEARRTPGVMPICATRLAETDIVLGGMRNAVENLTAEYGRLLAQDDPEAFANYGFAIRINNLKIACSQMLVDVVGRAMLICGISGYRNDSKSSLGRLLRDAYGASLMVNNDRILGQSALMQVGLRGD
jgi:acyl-CoA dehydrogenase